MEFNKDSFTIVGADYIQQKQLSKRSSFIKSLKGMPVFSISILLLIVLGCIFAEFIINHDPTQFYLANRNQAPNSEFFFGTDSLGRDIFSIIWYGGRVSIFIGLFSALIITVIGVAYGCLSGLAGGLIDKIMMRSIEILQSIPLLLTILLLISLIGSHSVIIISFVIGISGWLALARLVRSEVKQIRNNEYIAAARCMGASFPYLVIKHLAPNFISAILFVVISSISTSMAMESTLSFLGLGLPVEILSWGSMLALAERALLLNTWWVIVFPGLFLVVTLLCITNIGNYFRKEINKKPSNL